MFHRILAPGKLAVLTLLGTLVAATPAPAQQGQYLYEWSGGWTFSGGSAFPDDYKGANDTAPYSGLNGTTAYYPAPLSFPAPAYAYYPMAGNPAYAYYPMPANPALPASGQTISSVSLYPPAASANEGTSAVIHIAVPAQAEIWFDDWKTTQSGTNRQFVSPPLTSGRDYSYDVMARWTEQGKAVTQNRRITVRAGQVANVSFSPEK